jgi:hypothetical protein
MNCKVQLQERSSTIGAMGETVFYKPKGWIWAEVIPLTAKAIADYQQIVGEVTHKLVVRGTLDYDIGNFRVLWGKRYLKLTSPVQEVQNYTIILAKEDSEI